MVGIKKNRNMNLMLYGRFVSFLGTGAFTICLPLYVLEITHSMAMVGLFFSLANLPCILLSPFFGVWIEKGNLKKCLVVADFFEAGLFGILILFMLIKDISVTALLMFSIAVNITGACFSISSSSIFVHLVTKGELEQANARKSLLDNVATLIAPIIGTFLYGYFGILCVAFINALSFLISAIFELFIKYTKKSTDELAESFTVMLKGGVQFIYKQKAVLSYFFMIMLLNFLVAPTEEVFAPGIIKQKYQFPNTLYGWTSTAVAIGILFSSYLISKKNNLNLIKHLKKFFYAQGLLMIFCGILAVLLFQYNPYVYFYIFLLFSLISGVVSTLVNVPLISQFQTMVDPKYQARFFSLLSFSAQIMIPLGTYFAGIMSQSIGADNAYAMNGLILLVLVTIIYHYLIKKCFYSIEE